MIFSKLILFLGLFVAFAWEINASETLTPKKRGGKKKQEEKIVKKLPKTKSGPQKYSVFDKSFVSEDVIAKDIIVNHRAFFTETDDYNFKGLVLAYVTPWNNHGYDVAKIFGNKFTHISPVWLQIRRRGINRYEVTGTHDIDKQWVIDVRNAGRERKTKIVPRVLFDGWMSDDYKAVFTRQEELNAMIDTLIESCKLHKFDGYVFEVWTQIAAGVPSDMMVKFIRTISDAFILEELDFILVIPPRRDERQIFTEEQFDGLYDHVTAFSLMTYDYSSPQMPGPNAPIGWIEETIKSITSNETRRPKILMGLNFYGNDYSKQGGGPIVSHEYIQRLEKVPEVTLSYDPEVAEHSFEYRDDNKLNHIVYYPTLYSIFVRLDLAHKLNVGLSIWEIGQGLDYFYDLL